MPWLCPEKRLFQEDDKFTFHFYYLRNTSVHIVDVSAWPSQRWKGVQQWTNGQWQIRVLCGVTDWDLEHWHSIMRWNGCDQSRNKLEVDSPVWIFSGPFLHGISATVLSYTLLTQFNSLLTVTPIYASDETIDVKAVKCCHGLETNFLLSKSKMAGGKTMRFSLTGIIWARRE